MKRREQNDYVSALAARLKLEFTPGNFLRKPEASGRVHGVPTRIETVTGALQGAGLTHHDREMGIFSGKTYVTFVGRTYHSPLGMGLTVDPYQPHKVPSKDGPVDAPDPENRVRFGDDFDSRIMVTADDEARARALLDDEVRETIAAFFDVMAAGVRDDCVVATLRSTLGGPGPSGLSQAATGVRNMARMSNVIAEAAATL